MHNKEMKKRKGTFMEYISQEEMVDLLHERHFDMLCWLKNKCEEKQLNMYMWVAL